MAANDTVELAVQGTVGGQQHIHTLHFRHMQIGLSEQTLIDQWQAAARTAYRGMFFTFDNPVELIRARQVCGAVPLRAPAEEAEAAGNVAGTRLSGGQDALPTFVATVVSVRSILAGRSRRGRFFIGGMGEGDNAYNVVNPAYIALVQAYVDALLNTWGAGGTNVGTFQLVVHSRKLAAVPGTECQNSSTFVSGMIVRPNPATMRSRKLGHGN